ncbi:hypothetical protein HPB50_015475 [Hyalomma asiaticum]|uniref:Uncharacterized protein n=1 Tax=Hyalomma asiaticum TaxID=266040 RepID=A0ACB7S2U4_HYAAI|nr:hypothetical protein HPB50_015475 [Hyalomma asiaticum]
MRIQQRLLYHKQRDDFVGDVDMGPELEELAPESGHNYKVNVTAMDILCKGELTTRAPHPADSSKEIYLSYDQSHVIKNLRPQFLAKDFGKSKQVSHRST